MKGLYFNGLLRLLTPPGDRLIVSPNSGFVSSVTLTFDNAFGATPSSALEYGSLKDGLWTLSIPWLSHIHSNGTTLHRLFGDSNGDRTVDGLDFAAFGAEFGLTIAGSPFDINADGTIDGLDFAQFGSRFGTTI